MDRQNTVRVIAVCLGQFGVSLGSVWGHLGSIRRASRGIREHQGGILRSPGDSPGVVFVSFALFEKMDVRKINMRIIPGPEHMLSLGGHMLSLWGVWGVWGGVGGIGRRPLNIPEPIQKKYKYSGTVRNAPQTFRGRPKRCTNIPGPSQKQCKFSGAVQNCFTVLLF